MRCLRSLSACLGLLAGTVAAQSAESLPLDLKLEYLPSTATGLTAYLGDPQLGLEFEMGRVSWHASGRLFAFQGGYDLLHAWTSPTAAEPAKCLGALNAALPFALSDDGSLICAKVTPLDDLLQKGVMWTATRDISCCRFVDGKPLWTFRPEKSHSIDGVCFNPDATRVLLSDYHRQQRTLRLLNAGTGEELEHLLLPEAEEGTIVDTHNLVSCGRDFVALRNPKDQGKKLLYIQLDPLRAETISFKSSHQIRHLCLSQNGRWLVIYGQKGYEVLERKGQQWASMFSGNAGFVNDNLEAVTISADSRWLFVASEQQARVIDLDAGRVIKELNRGARGAHFAPDGSGIALAEHSGLAFLDAKTWTATDPPSSQHDCPVEKLLALPDNKTLISRDHNAFLVWDLPTRKPRAMLKSKRESARIGDAVLTKDSREIIAGDGWDFLRWRLPDLNLPAPDRPVVIEGELAFGSVPRDADECSYMSVQVDAAGERFATVTGSALQLRYLNQPGVVRTLSAAQSLSGLFFKPMAFADDHTLSIVDDRKGMQNLDLKMDGLRMAGTRPQGEDQFGPWLPGKSAVLLKQPAQFSLVEAGSAKTLQTWALPITKIEFGSVRNIAVTPDGKTAAAIVYDSSKSLGSFVAIWRADFNRPVALQPAQNLGIMCLTLTPDGRTLLAGHQNTAISVWDVETLVNAGVMPQEPPAKPATKPSTRTLKRPVLSVTSDEPARPLKDRRGHEWTFHADGSTTIAARLPCFGRMTVNGNPLTTKALRFVRAGDQDVLQYGVVLSREMEGAGAELCISRHLDPNSNLNGGSVAATEAFTNTSNRAIDVRIDFAIQFPADANGLLTTEGRRVLMDNDGRFALDAGDQWLAAAGSGKPGETLAAVRVNTWSNPMPPLTQWDSRSKTLHLHYEVTLPPGATRWLIHSLTLLKRTAEGALDIFSFPLRSDTGYHVLSGTQSEGLNFGKADSVLASRFERALPITMRQAPPEETDGLGFAWEMRHDLGRAGALGATAVHALWLDGRPPAFQAAQLIQPHLTNREPWRPSSVILRSLDSAISINRQFHAVEGNGATVWLDTYTNPSTQPQSLRASYLTSFRTPVVAVWDSHGKKHDFASLPAAGAEFGGACAFVLEGTQQPATLLAFHKDGAPLVPTVRRISNQSVALDFAIEMRPLSGLRLILGACQRPLAAFGSAEAAFADWLPLAPAATGTSRPRMAPQAPNGTERKLHLPILNYDLPDPSGQ